MQRLFTLLTVFLFSATLTFAQQARDDHDDSAPIQSGYAVVTPVVTAGTTTTTEGSTSGTTATTGLVVFETFGLRDDGGASTTQAGVLPPGLTTEALLFAESEGRLGKNLGVAIVNPNGSAVNMTLTLNNSGGTPIATGMLSVPSHQQVAKMVTDLFPATTFPTDVMGTLVVNSAGTSDLPVSVIGLRFRGANFSTIPATNLEPVSGPLPLIPTSTGGPDAGGPGAVLLPQFAAGGGWVTEIVMVNTNSMPITVRVDLFKQDGTPLTTGMNGQQASSFPNIVIAGGGVFELAPRDAEGDDDF